MAFIQAKSTEGYTKGSTFLENLPQDIQSKTDHLDVSEDLKSIIVVLSDNEYCLFWLPKQHQIKSVFTGGGDYSGKLKISCEDKTELLTIIYVINFNKLGSISNYSI